MTQENIPLQLNEEILPIRGYEGLYSITSHGRVWSHRREYIDKNGGVHKCGGLFRKQKLDGQKAYYGVTLNKSGFRRTYQMHRLIAQHYIPNPQNLPEVNHKDGNKQNNFVGTAINNYKDGNLEWCTDQENKKHALKKGLSKKKYSKFYGVTLEFGKYWRVRIINCGRKIHIGVYRTEIEAAQAYNDYIIEHKLNRPLNEVG